MAENFYQFLLLERGECVREGVGTVNGDVPPRVFLGRLLKALVNISIVKVMMAIV